MRALPLGHWVQFVWHAAALGLIALAAAMTAVMLRSLTRDALNPRARGLRWQIAGWSAVMASLLSVCVWPYLTAFARIEVSSTGAWCFENYLGFKIAELSPHEARSLVGEDLGGLRVGMGHLDVRLANGRHLRSVRISAGTFEGLCRDLGYAEGDVRDVGGSLVIPAHRFGARGPAMGRELALGN